MKKSLILVAAMFISTAYIYAQKFGALAVDRSNGYYYGWAYNYITEAGAETKALQECKSKGGNCTVVLSWEGVACGAYRTINGNVGTAYGWGIAATKEEADGIATKEAIIRSNGTYPGNYVWACNDGGADPFRVIKNEKATNTTEANTPKQTIEFNGKSYDASGDCPEGTTALLTADDESVMLMINNLPSGNATINADFYTKACMDCVAIQLQDMESEKTYVATSGTITRKGQNIIINIMVKELTELIEGTGAGIKVVANLVCE